PKPGTRAQIDAARAAAPRVAAAQAQRVQTLITGMPPALEQQVLDLVKQGQKIAAIRHYEREAAVDLTTAKDVVDRLIDPGRCTRSAPGRPPSSSRSASAHRRCPPPLAGTRGPPAGF